MTLLRSLFFLLILANLLLFARGQGYFGSIEQGREPGRLADQLSPGKLRIVPPQQPSAAAVPQGCRLVSGLDPDQARQLVQQLGQRAASFQATIESAGTPTSYRVLIPSLPNKQAAEKKLAEVRRLGILNASLAAAEGQQFAVVLGRFDSEQAARDRLGSLGKRGVKSAVVQAQGAQRVEVRVSGPMAALAAQLPPLLSGFTTASVAACAAKP